MSGADDRSAPLAHHGKRRSRPFQFSWSDPRFRNIVWQVLILGTVAAIVWYLVLQHEPEPRGAAYRDRVRLSWDATAGIPIGEHLIEYDPAHRHVSADAHHGSAC